MKIDINCDMGESYGIYKIGNDEEIFPFISSANIACGFHAGDPMTMLRTIQLAKEHGVAIGSHPGFPDRVGFGRREMKVNPEQLYADLIYQIGASKSMAESEGVALQHVKPHGALYNMAVVDQVVAETIVQAVCAIDRGLALYTLPHGALLEAARKSRLKVAREFFIDRTYQDDGSLTPRGNPDAMIKDATVAAHRALKMLKEKKVVSINGVDVQIEADTLCIHGDEPTAVLFAKSVYELLKNDEVKVSAIGRE